MSYMDGGLKFHTDPTHNRFVPRLWIADGIRRSIDDQVVEPGAQFVSKEDYDKMAYASELAALDGAKQNYSNGKVQGFVQGLGLCGFLTVLGLAILFMTSCSTPGPKPIRRVSSRAANVTANPHQAFVWIKFTDSRKALPVRIVDDLEVGRMVPGTGVMMVRVTDSAGVGLEVRGGGPNEPVQAVMLVK